MKKITTLIVALFFMFTPPTQSQNWCCCQNGCILDFFFIGCNAYCAGLGGGWNYGSDEGYPDNTCGGLSCPPPLPIELSYFEGSILEHNRVLLKWETRSEVNNRGFEIFRSNNGHNWISIAFVKGNGNTSEDIEYQYVDKFPSFGVNYYRLKQSDFDETNKFSDVIYVDIKGNTVQIGDLYPNPSRSGMVHLQYYSPWEETINIRVYDLNGKLNENLNYPIMKGSNNLYIDFTGLSKGMYTVRINNKLGQTNRKLINL